MILGTQFKPRPSAHGGQEVNDPEELSSDGNHFADTTESGKAKPLRQS